jgi:hypothetical protein
MQRAIIGFDSWTDELTFTGGSWNVLFPVSNVGNQILTKAAKSTDLLESSAQFTCTTSTIRPVRFLGICRHNLTDFGQFRIKIYSDVAKTDLLYDSDWQNAWLPAYSSYDDNWYRPGFWGGLYSPEEKEGITPTRLIWLDQVYFFQAIEVFFRDSTNPDGFISVGLFEVSEGYQVQYNPGYGARFGTLSRDVVIEAEGGIVYSESRQSARVFQGSISSMQISEAKQRFYEFQRRMKTGKPFLWMLDPDDNVNALRDGGLFRNAEIDLLAYAAHNVADVPINFVEVLG